MLQNLGFLVPIEVAILAATICLLVLVRKGKWTARSILWGGAIAFMVPLVSTIAESVSDWLFYLPLYAIAAAAIVGLVVRDERWKRPAKP